MNPIFSSRVGGALLLSACALITAGAATRKAAPSRTALKPAARKQAAPTKKAPVAAKPAATKAIPFPAVALGPAPASLPADLTYKDADLVVDYSSNWQGYLEPCG